MTSHNDLIRDQFTRQAIPFSTAPAIQDEEALQLLVKAAGAGPGDEALDVACGPGLVACAFARVVRRAAGIDITPAMVERALALKRELGLENVSFEVGDVLPLPVADGAYSIVTCRYSFHHFRDPGAVLREMARVARPGGRVVLADVRAADDPRRAEAYNRMEKLRDPSHVRALPLGELAALFPAAGLAAPRAAFYSLETDLEGLLSRSFPNPGDADEIRRLFRDSLADDGLGMATRLVGEEIHGRYPIVVLVAER